MDKRQEKACRVMRVDQAGRFKPNRRRSLRSGWGREGSGGSCRRQRLRLCCQAAGLLLLLFLLLLGAGELPDTVGAAASIDGPSSSSTGGANGPVQPSPVSLSAAGENKRVTVVSIPGLSYLELEEPLLEQLPALSRMARDGAVGALNVRTRGKGLADSYASLGSGAPAAARTEARGYTAGENIQGRSAAEHYALFHGSLPQGQVLVPAYRVLTGNPLNHHSDVAFGWLGGQLAAAGVSVQLYGNADEGAVPQAEAQHRHAALMVMDEKGSVERGDVSARTVEPAPDRPFFVRTGYRYMLERWREAEGRALLLLELGDMHRLYAAKDRLSPARFAELKLEVLLEADAFIGQLMDGLSPEDSLWVLSPLANRDAQEQKLLLTPILYWPGDGEASGSGAGGALIGSPTTRRPGLAANIDVAPTLLQQFGLEPVAGGVIPAGQPMLLQTHEAGLETLRAELAVMQRVYQLRPNVLYPLVIYEMAVLLLALGAVLLRTRRAAGWLALLLYSVLACPPVLLALGWLPGLSAAAQGAVLLAGTAAVSAVCTWIACRSRTGSRSRRTDGPDGPPQSAVRSTLTAAALLAGATAGLILLDGLTGANAMKRSVLGYDPMIGARYYGIGNELMGVLIGASVLGVSILLQLLSPDEPGLVRPRRGLRMAQAGAALYFAAVVLYMAAPGLGTNAGGSITAAVAFGLLLLYSWYGQGGRPMPWGRLFLLAGGLGLAALSVLFAVHGLVPAGGNGQSHIGRALEQLMAGRLDVIGDIVLRKLAMNWHLIGVSSWSKVLITSLFVMAVLLVRPGGVFARWRRTHPYLVHGFLANTIGAITALAVNDSGIVAAATMIVYVAVPLLLTRLAESAGPEAPEREAAAQARRDSHSL